MIAALAKELGISEHSLFGAISRASGGTLTLTWARDSFPWSPDGMWVEHSPAAWSITIIVGPHEKVAPVTEAAITVARHLERKERVA